MIVYVKNATAGLQMIAERFDFNGKFRMLNACHTSVVGMGPAIANRQSRDLADVVETLNEQQVEELLHIQVGPQDLNLFAFPLQCNFSGKRYPKEWITKLQKANHYVLVDGASYLSTGNLNLCDFAADFLVLSFYKLFGFPTGLGALLIRRDRLDKFEKCYFGGGSVQSLAIDPIYYSLNTGGEEMYDGTLSFQEIISLGHGFDYIENKFGSWKGLSDHCCGLASLARTEMANLRHINGNPLVKLYPSSLEDLGPIVSFNLLDPHGNIIGHSDVSRLASLENIHLRTGRFCNPGAAQQYLQLSSQEIMENHQNYGHKCGDSMDFLGEKATGAVRISFCFANTISDVQGFIKFLVEYFVINNNDSIPKSVLNHSENLDFMIIDTYIYPIKSCQAFKVTNWPISKSGFLYDREFILLNKSNSKMLNLKNCPLMASIQIDYVDCESKVLQVSCNGTDPIKILLQSPNAAVVDEWFSKYLQRDCKLVAYDHTTNISFVNKSQFLLCSQTSYEALCKSIPASDSVSVDILNFRPNIIISNQEPFIELDWIGKTLTLFNERLKVVDSCQRCQMVCIDKQGERHKEPLKTLSQSRANVNDF